MQTESQSRKKTTKAKKASAKPKAGGKRRGPGTRAERLKALQKSDKWTAEDEKKLKSAKDLLGEEAGIAGFLTHYNSTHGRIKVPKPDQYAEIAERIRVAVEKIREDNEGFKMPKGGFRVTETKKRKKDMQEGEKQDIKIDYGK